MSTFELKINCWVLYMFLQGRFWGWLYLLSFLRVNCQLFGSCTFRFFFFTISRLWIGNLKRRSSCQGVFLYYLLSSINSSYCPVLVKEGWMIREKTSEHSLSNRKMILYSKTHCQCICSLFQVSAGSSSWVSWLSSWSCMVNCTWRSRMKGCHFHPNLLLTVSAGTNDTEKQQNSSIWNVNFCLFLKHYLCISVLSAFIYISVSGET